MDAAELYEIEKSLWTNDPAAIGDEERENRHWAEVRFADQRVLSPTHDTRLLIYKATARWNHEEVPVAVLCSSIYALQSDGWKLVFHQQTPFHA